MQDNEVIKNILKCSRCGLCQGVCPVFEIVKNEQSTARGKLMQILGLKKGELTLNRKILKSLDLCLNCEKCKLNCPSGVDTTDVINSEKKLSAWGRFLNSEFIFNTKMTALRAFSLFKKQPRYEKNSKILYFEGCIARELKSGFTLPWLKLRNGNFKCCGIPYLTKGAKGAYKEIVEFNEKIIEGADLIIFDCATCYSAVKNYPFKNPKNKEKLFFYTDLYKEMNIISNKIYTVTFHMPCHLKSSGVDIKEVEQIINNTANLSYRPSNNAESCCGFGGDFFIRHPFIALKLSMKKAQDIIKTESDIVLTSCPTCLWSLKFSLALYSLIYRKKTPKAYDMAQFYNLNCRFEKELKFSVTCDNKKDLIKV